MSAYVSPLDAARRTGLSIEELLPHSITVGGEPMLPASTVERLAKVRNELAQAEQAEYTAGRLSPDQRKY